MLKELYEAADRFTHDKRWLPPFYKEKSPKWVIEIMNTEGIFNDKAFREDEFRKLFAPDRQRSSTSVENKPYLGLDKAKFVLQFPHPRTEWPPFWKLMREAAEKTKDKALNDIVNFAQSDAFNEVIKKLKNKAGADDLVGFRLYANSDFPFESSNIQKFWLEYLANELRLAHKGQCSVTGEQLDLAKIIPQEIVVMGQKCQISSFNKDAFNSFGKKQTANASISVKAIAKAIQTLQYLSNHPRHRAVLARGETRGGVDPLQNYFAVFWLQRDETGESDGREVNLEEMLSLPLREDFLDESKEDSESTEPFTPPVDLQQLDNFLRSPWTGKEIDQDPPDNQFYLGILSANTGRLVIRDWITVSLAQLRHNLVRFSSGLKIIGPWGDTKRIYPIPLLVKALRSEPRSDAFDPKDGGLFKKRRTMDSRHSELVRSLIRTAYLGDLPDPGTLRSAVQRFRNSRTLNSYGEIHVLAEVLKLVLTYNKKEAETMQTLDPKRNIPAYLSGRAFAILEEAQRRAADTPLNTTLVDRTYGVASLSPKSMLPSLIRTCEMGHLPKIRKKWKTGYDELRKSLEDISKRLDEAGGYPTTLSLHDQAEFALGFYCQRAEFRKSKSAPKVQNSGT
ncbi:conserved hypothetical protein [Syntrophobacter sp. SbD2]|nr:conserved hypothetical protein [Syntrophobacter sp. SbD2]